MTVHDPKDLVYAATIRCRCGAGMAYPKGESTHGSWRCSEVLKGNAAFCKTGHHEEFPFVFWDIKSEDQPSANGVTTRPT